MTTTGLVDVIASNEAKAVRKHLSKQRTGEALIVVGFDAMNYADRKNSEAHELTTIPPMACKAGCAWCCSVQVLLSAPEVFCLAEYLRLSSSPEDLILLMEGLKSQWEQVKDVPILERLLDLQR